MTARPFHRNGRKESPYSLCMCSLSYFSLLWSLWWSFQSNPQWSKSPCNMEYADYHLFLALQNDVADRSEWTSASLLFPSRTHKNRIRLEKEGRHVSMIQMWHVQKPRNTNQQARTNARWKRLIAWFNFTSRCGREHISIGSFNGAHGVSPQYEAKLFRVNRVANM